MTTPLQRIGARISHQLRRLYWRIFRPLTLGVAAVVVDAQNQVWLVRNSYRDGWHLPGGGVKRGETMTQAIQRELQEELGLNSVPEPREILGVYSNFSDRSYDHVVVFVVQVDTVAPLAQANFEIEATCAYPLSSLPPDVGAGSERRIREFTTGGSKSFVW